MPVRRMLINAAEPDEVRIALADDTELLDFFIDRPQASGAHGNIYKGLVQNVEPAIQAAFVDIGLPKNGFLHVSDVIPMHADKRGKGHSLAAEYDDYAVKARASEDERPTIQQLLRKGQEVLVMITKTQIQHKGPSLSTYLSIPGRYLVLMPNLQKVAASRKIEDDKARQELTRILEEIRPPGNLGFIARTAAAGQTKKAIQSDMEYLAKLWRVILARMKTAKAPACLFQESDSIIKTLRDDFHADMDEVVLDRESAYRKAYDFMRLVMPGFLDRVKLYVGKPPIFEKYGIEREIRKLFDAKVPLPSGGHIVIEQTEALVAIDVNSGKFTKERDAEQTALKTNVEAAEEICRQLRLRDLGGLIINDFIDMREPANRRTLENTMKDALARDRAKTKVCRTSPLGLIEMTRQRLKESHVRTTHQACPTCRGTGHIMTPGTLALYLMRKIKKGLAERKSTGVRVTGPLEMIERLQNERREVLLRLEREAGKPVELVGDPTQSPQDIAVTYVNTNGKHIQVL